MVDVSSLIKRGIPQVSPNRPTTRVDPNAAGVGLLGEVINLGGAAADLGLTMLNTEAETAATKSDTALSEKIRIRLYGDGTEQNRGHFNLSGQEALDDRQAVDDDITRFRTEALEGLGPRARRKALDSANKRAAAALGGIAREGVVSQKKVQIGAFIAREDEAVQSAAAAAGTPDADMHVQTAGSQAQQRAKAEGAGPKEQARAKKIALTKAHTAVITALLGQENGGAKRAEEYFNKNLVEIDGSVRKGLKDSINKVGVVQTSQGNTDTIMGTYQGSSKNKEAKDAAIKSATDITDPKVRDATLDRVRKRLAQDTMFENAETRNLRLSALQKINDNPEDPKLTLPEKLSILELTNGVRILSGRDQIDEKTGAKNTPDKAFIGKLSKMSPAELAKQPLTSDKSTRLMGTAGSKWLIEQGKAIQKLEQGIKPVFTPKAIAVEAAKTLSDTQAEAFNARFEIEVQAAAKVAGVAKGEDLSGEAVKKIADRLTLSMRREIPFGTETDEGFWGFFGKDEVAKAFNISPDRINEFEVNDITTNHDNLRRMFNLSKANSIGIITATKNQFGKATLPNIKRAVNNALKAAAAKK